jgi:hypothetical protein
MIWHIDFIYCFPSVICVREIVCSERRSLSPSRLVPSTEHVPAGPGDFDLLATRAPLLNERAKVLTLEVSVPSGSGSHGATRSYHDSPHAQLHTIYGETVVDNAAVMNLPPTYHATGNACLLEIDDIAQAEQKAFQSISSHKSRHSGYDSGDHAKLSRLADVVIDSVATNPDGSVSPLHLNPPRVGKGPYTSPRNVDLYHDVEDTIEEAPLASHDFHPHRLLEVPHHYHASAHTAAASQSVASEVPGGDDMTDTVRSVEEDSHLRKVGMYMRNDDSTYSTDEDRQAFSANSAMLGDARRVELRTAPVGEGEGRPLTDTVNVTESAAADGGFTKSVLTRQLLGRSTWDRVVGMQSSFAREFIATQLKDPRIVFIINTAGADQRAYTPLPYSPVTAPEIGYLFEAFPDPVEETDEEEWNDGQCNEKTGLEGNAPLTDESGEMYDFFPAATPPLTAPRPESQGLSLSSLRPPQSPKPSFSRRRHHGVAK